MSVILREQDVPLGLALRRPMLALVTLWAPEKAFIAQLLTLVGRMRHGPFVRQEAIAAMGFPKLVRLNLVVLVRLGNDGELVLGFVVQELLEINIGGWAGMSDPRFFALRKIAIRGLRLLRRRIEEPLCTFSPIFATIVLAFWMIAIAGMRAK